LATTFDYGDDKLVKVEEAQLSNNGTVSNLTYLDGKIVKQEWFTSTNLLTDRQEYEYSGNQLVKIQEYVDSRTGFVKSEYRVLEYSDDTNNPSRVTYFNADNTTNFTAEYTYGDKHAATGAVPPEFLVYEMLDGLSQDKNVLQIVFSTGTEIDYTYEFNESGYPTKRTETYSTGQVNIQTNTFDCK
jgi:hypothetical protein